MKLTIINGTNRIGNQTQTLTDAVTHQARALGHEVSTVELTNFVEMFRGEYLTLSSSTGAQREDLRKMVEADCLLFVVPTYHSGLPGSLKNFLDLIKCTECYDRKVVSFIAGSDHNQNLGARQAMQVVNGILSYQKSFSFTTPRITTLDFDDVDTSRIREHLEYCQRFVRLYGASVLAS